MKRNIYPNSSYSSKEVEMIETLKKKKYIDDEMADFIVNKVVETFGPNFARTMKKDDINMKDIIRFRMVAETCRNRREKKGLSFKQIAAVLKVPQYRLQDIEKSSVRYIKVDVLKNYVDYFGLCRWFNAWKKNNQDVYERLLGRK